MQIHIVVVLPVNKCKYVEHRGHVWMVSAGSPFQIFQCLFTKWHCHFIPSLWRILDDEVMKSPEPRRDLIPSTGLLDKLTRWGGWHGYRSSRMRYAFLTNVRFILKRKGGIFIFFRLRNNPGRRKWKLNQPKTEWILSFVSKQEKLSQKV